MILAGIALGVAEIFLLVILALMIIILVWNLIKIGFKAVALAGCLVVICYVAYKLLTVP